MNIKNDRNISDYFYLYNLYWSGMSIGSDRYPIKDEYGGYLIGGGEDYIIKATAIEFYGVKVIDNSNPLPVKAKADFNSQ